MQPSTRISAQVQPRSQPVFLTADWRKLLMVQYEIDPAVLAPHLPRGTGLDLYEGVCYVSLVGFLFDRVRLKGLPIPLHTRFPEVNLRFYVRRREPDGSVRRGVVFINEFVPRRNLAVALLAKSLYEEPYRAVPMRTSITVPDSRLHVAYHWKTGGRWHEMSAVASPSPQPISTGSVREFITEHYWGYTRRHTDRPEGRTSAYQVEHPRWQTYPIRSWKLEVDFAKMYGPQWSFLTETPVANALLAEGSPVKVHTGADLALTAANLPR